jgi:hypothetical protein
MYKKPNIVTTLKVMRLEWAGHLLRTSDDRTVKKAERPKLRCSDCTKNDMKSTGVKRWRKKPEYICMDYHSYGIIS